MSFLKLIFSKLKLQRISKFLENAPDGIYLLQVMYTGIGSIWWIKTRLGKMIVGYTKDEEVVIYVKVSESKTLTSKSFTVNIIDRTIIELLYVYRKGHCTVQSVG